MSAPAELPPLPHAYLIYQVSSDSDFASNWGSAYTADQMREYGRQCAALATAPASPQPELSGSIDTDEFSKLLAEVSMLWLQDPLRYAHAREKLVTHIDAWKDAALAELHPLWLAEKERADRLQTQSNEEALDKLLADVPSYCVHQFEPDGQSHGKTFWRCSKCGAERQR